VLLAAMLPAPRRVDLAHPSAWLRARATRLLDRLHDERQIGDDEHRSASAALARLLGDAAPADDRAEPPEDEPPAAPAPGGAGGAEATGVEPGKAEGDAAPPPPDQPAQLPPDQSATPPPDEPAAAEPQGGGTAAQSEGAPPAQDPPPQE